MTVVPTDKRFDKFDEINHGETNYINENANTGFINIVGTNLTNQNDLIDQ